ncbi:MAG: hypothetical protein WDN31_03420 [Hyphomicrobium sp.]
MAQVDEVAHVGTHAHEHLDEVVKRFGCLRADIALGAEMTAEVDLAIDGDGIRKA